MALFGSKRDVSLIRSLNRELINKIVAQEIGYYKLDLNATNSNIYGESNRKFYYDPVLIRCLIQNNSLESSNSNGIVDISRSIQIRFLKDILIHINLVPEIGDVVIWNNDFYEIDNVDQSQLVLGKNPDYAYTDYLEDFGSSLSIIVNAHYTRPEKFGLSNHII